MLVTVSRQPVSTYLPASTFANCGNIGLPLALFAFGKDGLALAIAYLAVHGVFNFVIGQALAAGRFSFRETLFSPLLWATALGAALSVTGSAAAPVARPRRPHPRRPDHPDDAAGARLVADQAQRDLAQMAARVLGAEARSAALRSDGASRSRSALTGTARGVLVIESAMPVAVYNYMFAARYNNRPEDVAGLVVVSTLLSLGALPLFLSTVM